MKKLKINHVFDLVCKSAADSFIESVLADASYGIKDQMVRIYLRLIEFTIDLDVDVVPEERSARAARLEFVQHR